MSALAGSFFTQSAAFPGWWRISRRNIVEVVGGGRYQVGGEVLELESADMRSHDTGAPADEVVTADEVLARGPRTTGRWT